MTLWYLRLFPSFVMQVRLTNFFYLFFCIINEQVCWSHVLNKVSINIKLRLNQTFAYLVEKQHLGVCWSYFTTVYAEKQHLKCCWCFLAIVNQ